MTRTWLSIRVELVEGRGERLWPRPGRIFAAATRLATPYGDDDELGPALDDRRTRLSRLRPGEQFLYTFDLGDDWTHLCTCLLYTSDAADDLLCVDLGGRRIIKKKKNHSHDKKM